MKEARIGAERAHQLTSRDLGKGRRERRFLEWSAIGLILSTALHFAFFVLLPPLHVRAAESAGKPTTAVNLPPTVRVPPAPEPIARPAVPRVSITDVSEDVTIAPTTFEANPVERLPLPPKPTATPRAEEDHPRFIPYDTPPRLLNGKMIQALLAKSYPESLRLAGIEAKVTLWIHIDEDGGVVRALVHESCGYPPMDAVALRVSHAMKFSPAKNRDRVTSVWVQQTLVFEII